MKQKPYERNCIKALLLVLLLFIPHLSFAAETIEVWHRWNEEERLALIKNISKFETVTGQRVRLRYFDYKALTGKFISLTKAGRGPDLIITSSSRANAFLHEGLLAPINRYVSQRKKDAFIQSTLNDANNNGVFHGLPVTYKLLALIYNKDKITKPPQTTDELIETGRRFTDVSKGVYGLAYPIEQYYYQAPWITGFNGKILENGKFFFDSKEQIDALYFSRSLHLGDHAIMPEGVNYDLMLSLFVTGKTPMMINGTWIIGDLLKEKMNIGVTLIPKNSKTGLYPKPFVASELIMMSEKSTHKDAAYQLMDFLTSESAQLENSRSGHLPSLQRVYDLEEFKKGSTYEILSGFKKQADKSIVRPREKAMGQVVMKIGDALLKKTLYNEEPVEPQAHIFQKKALQLIEEVE